MKTIVEDMETVKEMKTLMFIPPHWISELTKEHGKVKRQPQLDTRAHFLGMVYDSTTKQCKRHGPLNPAWVEHFFEGVFVELTKIQPRHWWPVVLGRAREENDQAPKELLVNQVKVKYPQFDRELCLVNSVASTLFHCGEKEASRQLMQMAGEFEFLTKPLALKKLKEVMRIVIPCIGDCEVFNNVKAKKKRSRTYKLRN